VRPKAIAGAAEPTVALAMKVTAFPWFAKRLVKDLLVRLGSSLPLEAFECLGAAAALSRPGTPDNITKPERLNIVPDHAEVPATACAALPLIRVCCSAQRQVPPRVWRGPRGQR
jgi:hypothetical protein